MNKHIKAWIVMFAVIMAAQILIVVLVDFSICFTEMDFSNFLEKLTWKLIRLFVCVGVPLSAVLSLWTCAMCREGEDQPYKWMMTWGRDDKGENNGRK